MTTLVMCIADPESSRLSEVYELGDRGAAIKGPRIADLLDQTTASYEDFTVVAVNNNRSVLVAPDHSIIRKSPHDLIRERMLETTHLTESSVFAKKHTVAWWEHQRSQYQRRAAQYMSISELAAYAVSVLTDPSL